MTPHVASSLVADLVEMAKATERLPEVEAENARLQAQHVEDGNRISSLELRLMDHANEITNLNARIRSLEVERDDYGFRALAADDKANAFASVLRSMEASIRQALSAAEPDPEVVSTPTVSGEETPAVASLEIGLGAIASEGVSVPPLPLVPLMADLSVPTAALPEPAATESIPQTSGATPASGPYTGKLYMREPGYINRYEWLAGGGTEEAYDWRPSQPLPEGFTDYKVA